MRLWNWACLKGNSVGSATTVANREARQQSIRVVVKHFAPTDASLPGRRPQDHIGNKKTNKIFCFSLYRVLLVICRVFWQGSHNFLKVPIVCHCLARNN